MSSMKLKGVNVDINCQGQCESCSRFFDCTDSKKLVMYERPIYNELQKNIAGVRYKIAILSGKGGVGKSTISVNLAAGLQAQGFKTGIVDLDFSGPSVPHMLGIAEERPSYDFLKGIIPVRTPLGIEVMSTAFIMEADGVLTWVHSLRRGAVRDFLSRVAWSELDFLIFDLPPGTGSEVISLLQFIPFMDGAIIVTIPSDVSQKVARRSITLCQKAKIKVFGIIENMSGFVCPHCELEVQILQNGGGEKIAKEFGLPLLGKIPLDSRICLCADEGKPFICNYPDSIAAKNFASVISRIKRCCKIV